MGTDREGASLESPSAATCRGGGADAFVVADRLFAAIEAGDIDAVSDLYAPDVVIWHNTDGIGQSREENLRTLGWVVRHLQDRRYAEVRRSATADGFVQQHVLQATTADGRRVEVPACIAATCAGGFITRIDEYLDSDHVARLTGGQTS